MAKYRPYNKEQASKGAKRGRKKQFDLNTPQGVSKYVKQLSSDKMDRYYELYLKEGETLRSGQIGQITPWKERLSREEFEQKFERSMQLNLEKGKLKGKSNVTIAKEIARSERSISYKMMQVTVKVSKKITKFKEDVYANAKALIEGSGTLTGIYIKNEETGEMEYVKAYSATQDLFLHLLEEYAKDIGWDKAREELEEAMFGY